MNQKQIEVQVIGDKHGNIVHLYERDCSIQRRHQKVVEIEPSISLSANLRERICTAAVSLMQNVQYVNIGTVEFLLTEYSFYLVEVNVRIQVEHTIFMVQNNLDEEWVLDTPTFIYGLKLGEEIELFSGYACTSITIKLN